MVLRILGSSTNLSGDTPWRLATDFSQAISWSPGCGVAVCADAGGHAAIVLVGDINLR